MWRTFSSVWVKEHQNEGQNVYADYVLKSTIRISQVSRIATDSSVALGPFTNGTWDPGIGVYVRWSVNQTC